MGPNPVLGVLRWIVAPWAVASLLVLIGSTIVAGCGNFLETTGAAN